MSIVMFEDHPPIPLPKPTSAQLRIVHQACERFERAWRQGQSLTIEQLLVESTLDVRPYLLEALVRSELEMLDSSGTQVEPQQYIRRFATDSGIIARAFMSPDKLEQLDSQDELQTPAPDDPGSSLDDPFRPQKLGPYEIRGEIGRGGMGVVYRGWHDELQREVAIKCIRASRLVDDATIQRFRREAQTVAALKHDGIVPIYDVGNDDGLNYFVMPLIDGENLAAHLAREPLTHRELARIVHDSAVATQFAHRHGVVHRDLKPHNILVDRSRKVWVTDFGVAKTLQPKPQAQTSSDRDREVASTQIVGTPSFMAPEQLTGQVTELTDVYGLGAILYAGLTGRPPHRAATVIETFKQIAENEPVAPRALDPQIPRDLETITLKALSKEPANRYASAQALADDLTRFIDGRPILAKATSTPDRIWRWMKREPVVAGLASGIIAALSIGLCVSVWFYREATHSAQAANRSADTARQTVQSYLIEVAESPELGEQGLEVLRQKLLHRALTFYEDLAQQSPDDILLREQIATAHQQLANIQKSLGDSQQAIEQYQQMESAFRQLADQSPTRTDYALAVVEAILERAQILSDKNLIVDAEDLLQKGLSLCETVSREQDSQSARVYMAALFALKAEYCANTGKGDEHQRTIAEATQLYKSLIATLPQTNLSVSSSRRLINAIDKFAAQLATVNQIDFALELSRAGLDYVHRQSADIQADPEMKFLEARLHKGLNLMYGRLGDREHAEQEYELANASFAELQKRHPLVSKYLDAHVAMLSNRATVLANSGDYPGAQAVIEQAIGLQQRLTSQNPSMPDYPNGLSNMYATLGAIQRLQGLPAQSEASLKRGLQVSDEAEKIAGLSEGILYFRLNLKSSLSDTLVVLKRPEEATELLQSITPQAQKLWDDHSQSMPFMMLVAGIYRTLATTERKLNHLDAAQTAAEQGIATYEKIPAPSNSIGMLPRLFIDSTFTQAYCLFKKNKFLEARAAIDRVLAFINPLLENPNVPLTKSIFWRTPRADVLDLAGQIAAAENDHAKAKELYVKALADQQLVFEAIKEVPGQLRAAKELHASVQLHYAATLMQLKEWDEALKACDIAIEIDSSEAEQAKLLKSEIEKVNKRSP